MLLFAAIFCGSSPFVAVVVDELRPSVLAFTGELLFFVCQPEAEKDPKAELACFAGYNVLVGTSVVLKGQEVTFGRWPNDVTPRRPEVSHYD